MSIVGLQLGQCGNQLGYALYDKLHNELESYNSSDKECFFRSSQTKETSSKTNSTARAVLIDTEPKVILKCARSTEHSGLWSYDHNSLISQQSGSGNNWAYGYTVHGAECMEVILETIRKEVEHCDYLKGCLGLQSLAGGTGSGLGSCITDALRDAFKPKYLMNTVVWPYSSGEVIVQNYNTLLSMASLLESSDGIVVLQNDIADKICRKLLHIDKPSFEQMNRVLSNHLASVLLPVVKHKSTDAADSTFNTIIQDLCSHPGYKLLSIKLLPQLSNKSREFSTHQWNGVLKHLHQVANSELDEGINWNISLDNPTTSSAINRTLASILYLRGTVHETYNYAMFEDPRMYTRWHPDPFQSFVSSNSFSNYTKMASLISNSQSILAPLKETITKGYEMYQANAYVHQYEQHGVDRDFFDSCFLRLDQTVLNYSTL